MYLKILFKSMSVTKTYTKYCLYGVGNNDYLPSRAKTVRVMGKSTSYSDSTSKNTFKKFNSLIKRRWFGLQLQL